MGRDSFLREFSDSLERVGQYPVNLISTDSYHHRLQSYLTRLNDSERNLCCDEGNAQLSFWTCEEQGCGQSYCCCGGYDLMLILFLLVQDSNPTVSAMWMSLAISTGLTPIFLPELRMPGVVLRKYVRGFPS